MLQLDYNSTLKKYIPLTFIDKETLLLSKKRTLYTYNTKNKVINKALSLPLPIYKKILLHIGLFSRILRLSVRYALPLSKYEILIVFNKAIFEINLQTKKYKQTFNALKGHTPLNITKINDIKGFDKACYFGEYFGNLNKSSVNIYKRMDNGFWEVVFTFPKGTIEHIHSIIDDKYRNCVWIFTGDFDRAAGIWMTEDNFKTVVPILIGEQKYRACVAFPIPEGLLYATDSQLEENSIRLLAYKNSKWKSEYICSINGPVIYGCKVNENMFFSTSVEGNCLSKNLFIKYIDRLPGPGLKDNYSYIIGGNIYDGFNILFKNQKDLFPFILFQFGSIKFPSNRNYTNSLFTFNTALKHNNFCTDIFNIKTTL